MWTGARGGAGLLLAAGLLVTCGGVDSDTADTGATAVEEQGQEDGAPRRTDGSADDRATSTEVARGRGSIIFVLEYGSEEMDCSLGTLCIDTTTLAGVEPDRGDLRVVSRLSEYDVSGYPPASTPPDHSLVALSRHSEAGLDVIDPATGDVVWTGLEGMGSFVVGWSPDAQHLAVYVYSSAAPGRDSPSIVMVSLENDDVVELISSDDPEVEDTWVSLSPGGELFAYGTPVRVVDVESGQEVTVPYVPDDNVFGLHWLPDGEHVLAVTEEGSFVQDLEGNTTLRLGDSWPLSFSPDGTWALTEERGAGESGDDLVVTAHPLDGGPAVTLAREAFDEGGYGGFDSALWSPEGDEVALSDGTSITVYPLDGRDPEVVLEIDQEQGYITLPLSWVPTTLDGPPITLKLVDDLGPSGRLATFDLRTGERNWTADLGGAPADPYHEGRSIGEDGAVYTVVGRGIGEAVVAVDADGEVQWTVELPGVTFVRAGPPVIVALNDGSTVAALDPADGTLLWEQESYPEHLVAIEEFVVVAHGPPGRLIVLDRRTGDEIESSRLCRNCWVEGVAADAEHIVAFTSDTKIVEPSVEVSTTHVVDVGTWPIRALPDVGPSFGGPWGVVDGMVVTMEYDVVPPEEGTTQTVRAVDVATGAMRWERTVAGGFAGITGDEQVHLFGDSVLVLDAATGADLWTTAGGAYDVEVDDEVVVLVSHDGVGTRVHARDVDDGELRWEWFVSDGPRDVSVGAGTVALVLHRGDELSAARAEDEMAQPPPMAAPPIEEAPAETEAPEVTEIPPPEMTPEVEGPLTLRDVLDSIEARANADPVVLDDGNVLLARVGPCATGTPDSWHGVDDATPAHRGMTVLCTSSSEPEGYAEMGERLVVVLDDSGTVATQVSTDGSTSQPFVAPEGMLCRDYLATFYEGDEHRGPWEYTELLAYWFLEGAPDRMDIDLNGIPCETLFPSDVVTGVWSGVG